MANDINKIFLIGRLTRDPELRSTSTGHYYCKFSLASNRSYYKKEGDLHEEVGYFDCISWGKSAEIVSKYLQKGKRVAVEGSLRWSQWENQEGKKQSKVEINVDNFQFLDPKSTVQNDSSNLMDNSANNQTNNTNNSEATPQYSGGSDIIDDDIPF